MSAKGPAKAPCKSCPYRRDVPSGVWHESEYDKLPDYDAPDLGSGQPIGAFYCHQSDGRLCAGWVGCHDMDNNIGLRMAVSYEHISAEDYHAALDYESPVELFESGAEAAAHGKKQITSPDTQARRAIARLERKKARRGAST